MAPRRIVAFGLRGALAYCCAVLVHGIVHALGSRSFQPDSPAHIAMTLIALALLAAIAAPLGLVGARAERRRRLALVRAVLGRPTPGRFIAGLFAQGLLALLLLASEGAELAPDRYVTALVWGLIALLFSSWLLAESTERIVALLVALVSAGGPKKLGLRSARSTRPSRTSEPYQLFVPNRPPPAAG